MKYKKEIYEVNKKIVHDYVFYEIDDVLAINEEIMSIRKSDEADIIRVEVAANAENEYFMQKNNFYFADRTIKTSLSLSKLPKNIEKMQRVEIIEAHTNREKIKTIAYNSFHTDRRFHLLEKCDNDFAEIRISQYIDDLFALDKSKIKIYQAIFEDNSIGFLALKEISEENVCIYLAAVEEKFRLLGTAQALYAKAIIEASKKYKIIEGRISSNNMPVMNLYASFGAKFSSPQNVFLKEFKENGNTKIKELKDE